MLPTFIRRIVLIVALVTFLASNIGAYGANLCSEAYDSVFHKPSQIAGNLIERFLAKKRALSLAQHEQMLWHVEKYEKLALAKAEDGVSLKEAKSKVYEEWRKDAESRKDTISEPELAALALFEMPSFKFRMDIENTLLTGGELQITEAGRLERFGRWMNKKVGDQSNAQFATKGMKGLLPWNRKSVIDIQRHVPMNPAEFHTFVRNLAGAAREIMHPEPSALKEALEIITDINLKDPKTYKAWQLFSERAQIWMNKNEKFFNDKMEYMAEVGEADKKTPRRQVLMEFERSGVSSTIIRRIFSKLYSSEGKSNNPEMYTLELEQLVFEWGVYMRPVFAALFLTWDVWFVYTETKDYIKSEKEEKELAEKKEEQKKLLKKIALARGICQKTPDWKQQLTEMKADIEEDKKTIALDEKFLKQNIAAPDRLRLEMQKLRLSLRVKTLQSNINELENCDIDKLLKD